MEFVRGKIATSVYIGALKYVCKRLLLPVKVSVLKREAETDEFEALRRGKGDCEQ